MILTYPTPDLNCSEQLHLYSFCESELWNSPKQPKNPRAFLKHYTIKPTYSTPIDLQKKQALIASNTNFLKATRRL